MECFLFFSLGEYFTFQTLLVGSAVLGSGALGWAAKLGIPWVVAIGRYRNVIVEIITFPVIIGVAPGVRGA